MRRRRVPRDESRRLGYGSAMAKARAQIRADDVHQELLPGVSPALLKALHLLTREGGLNADARRKLKQVAHLLRLLKPALDDILARYPTPVVVDCGAGKAYLGMLLAQTVLAPAGKGLMLGLEARKDLVDTARQVATEAGLTAVRLSHVPVEQAVVPERVHLVTALHACDTATDDALALALAVGADHVALVPCCQAEVARQLADAPGADPVVHTLSAHALHRRELGSHLTNVIRALVLEAHGYQVTVTELTGWEHSLKNELILGRRVHRENAAARARLEALVAATGARPKILRLLEAAPARAKGGG